MSSRSVGRFVRLSVDFYADPIVWAVSDAAVVLFVRALTWSAAHGTDGIVPRSSLLQLHKRPSRPARELVEAGLWEQDRDDFRIAKYAKWQETQAEIVQLRQAAAERKRRSRAQREAAVTRDKSVTAESSAASVTRDRSRVSQRESRVSHTTDGDGDRDRDVTTSPTGELALAAPHGTAQTLIAEWVDFERQAKGSAPPKRVLGQIAKELGQLVAEQPYERVRAGLAQWARSEQHPSTLASFVHRVGQPSPRRRSTTDERVQQGLALVAHFEQLDGGP